MTWDVTVDGVRLNDLCRFTVVQGQQWSALPAVNLSSVQLPGMHGVMPVLGGDTFQPAAFVIKLLVAGVGSSERLSSPASQSGYDSAIDVLLALFGDRHAMRLVQRVMGDGTVRQAQCRVSDAFTPDPIGAGMAANVSVALEIPGVFWEDVDASLFTGTPGAVSPHAEVVSTLSGGTAPVEDGQIIVDGPVTNPRVSQPDSGAWVSFAGTVPAGEQWIVDSGNWSTTVGGQSVIPQTSYAGSGARFFTMTPVAYSTGGGSTLPQDLPFVLADPSLPQRLVKLTLTGSGMGATTNLSVSAKRKYF